MITFILSIILTYLVVKKIFNFFSQNDSGEPWLGIPDDSKSNIQP